MLDSSSITVNHRASVSYKSPKEEEESHSSHTSASYNITSGNPVFQSTEDDMPFPPDGLKISWWITWLSHALPYLLWLPIQVMYVSFVGSPRI